jgi:hypothetical protein
MFSGQRNSPTSTQVELMSQSGRPHNAIRVANLPLELELRLWEERRNMYNGFLVAFGSHFFLGSGGLMAMAGALVRPENWYMITCVR